MKNITLTVTTGRSGTQLLHSLLKNVEGMDGDHENERRESFGSVRKQNLFDKSIGEKFVKEYLEYIDNLPGKYYSNTDLSNSKGAIEHYVNLGATPNIIILRRDPRLVATSFFSLGTIPIPNKLRYESMSWYPTPDEPGVLPFENYQKAHTYQYCYWYCCDCERRAIEYKNLLKNTNCKIWETTTAQLLNLTNFNEMLEHFNLPTVNYISTNKVDRFSSLKWDNVPPRDFLYPLEIDVLNRIPTDFKDYLISQGWGEP